MDTCNLYNIFKIHCHSGLITRLSRFPSRSCALSVLISLNSIDQLLYYSPINVKPPRLLQVHKQHNHPSNSPHPFKNQILKRQNLIIPIRHGCLPVVPILALHKSWSTPFLRLLPPFFKRISCWSLASPPFPPLLFPPNLIQFTVILHVAF